MKKTKKLDLNLKNLSRSLKFKPRLKYGWFHLKLYSIFQELSRRSNVNRFFADLSRDSNSLNSDTGIIKAPIKIIYIFEKCEIIINFLESGSKISAIWITEYSA